MTASLPYQRVVIIFNPNSTGDGPRLARELKEGLEEQAPQLKVELTGTESAGHAVELAREAAGHSKSTLIVSASGDGGYHEVINGALQAVRKPMCLVLPSGNANDHAAELEKRPVLEAILAGHLEAIDVLAVRSGDRVEYAHSYAGLGLSPAVAVELNQTDLNPAKELMLVARTFWRLQPMQIEINGRKRWVFDLVFANVGRMAKVLRMPAKPKDGQFEVIQLKAMPKWRLLGRLAQAAMIGLPASAHTDHFTFKVMEQTAMLLDGELMELAAGAEVQVTCRSGAVLTPR